jgi:hypothetical protein
MTVRHGLRDQRAAHEGWEICGDASDRREAVKLALELKPNTDDRLSTASTRRKIHSSPYSSNSADSLFL